MQLFATNFIKIKIKFLVFFASLLKNKVNNENNLKVIKGHLCQHDKVAEP